MIEKFRICSDKIGLGAPAILGWLPTPHHHHEHPWRAANGCNTTHHHPPHLHLTFLSKAVAISRHNITSLLPFLPWPASSDGKPPLRLRKPARSLFLCQHNITFLRIFSTPLQHTSFLHRTGHLSCPAFPVPEPGKTYGIRGNTVLSLASRCNRAPSYAERNLTPPGSHRDI